MQGLFILNMLMALGCVYISKKYHFANWAENGGSLTHPDPETLMIGNMEIAFASVQLGTATLVYYICLLIQGPRSINRTKTH